MRPRPAVPREVSLRAQLGRRGKELNENTCRDCSGMSGHLGGRGGDAGPSEQIKGQGLS